MNEIGSQIRKARKDANMTQKEFAVALGKSERMIQKYESGEVLPPLSMLYKMGDVLKIEINIKIFKNNML